MGFEILSTIVLNLMYAYVYF